MVKVKKETLNLNVKTYRKEDQKRLYSNFVEVSTTEIDVSIRFADLKPPRSAEEVEKIKKNIPLEIPIDAEIVMPMNVAKELLRILKDHLEISDRK